MSNYETLIAQAEQNLAEAKRLYDEKPLDNLSKINYENQKASIELFKKTGDIEKWLEKEDNDFKKRMNKIKEVNKKKYHQLKTNLYNFT
ncbi:MAG: hypothetical protein KJ646_01440 [Nanoarchaeota archaeon]|nr:hypothetical protein [Nanoarchaeota archaeon]MBU4116237.1 hypothetical protein [Nanoarchaeota archaeon]MBU4311083.1 hypothetical protein [bacterium]